MDFIHIKILDIIDILLVAFLIFQLYRLTKGTSVLSIFMGILAIYILWLVVRALKMELLSLILGQIIGVGVIALLIVFQPEIRRFLLHVGNRYFSAHSNFFRKNLSGPDNVEYIEEIVLAAESMSNDKTGALIVIGRMSSLKMIEETGDELDAVVSQRLIETIFFKNTPLHDGAILIVNRRVTAARCILPTSERMDIPARYGTRHRAAIGITEKTDAVVVVVSEETGKISIVEKGVIQSNITPLQLKERLLKSV